MYESWFEKVATLLASKYGSRSVAVIDNAKYHLRYLEEIPTTAKNKEQIQELMEEKGIEYEETYTKKQLLSKIKDSVDSNERS